MRAPSDCQNHYWLIFLIEKVILSAVSNETTGDFFHRRSFPVKNCDYDAETQLSTYRNPDIRFGAFSFRTLFLYN
jgi:hypothetical protein